MADPEEGTGGLNPPGKSQVLICSLEILGGIPFEKPLDPLWLLEGGPNGPL